MPNSESNRPVHVVRYGSIKASVWRNSTRNGAMYNVTLVRSYKDGNDWKDSSGFGFDDLLVLAKAVDECHTWIHQRMASDSAGGRDKDEVARSNR